MRAVIDIWPAAAGGDDAQGCRGSWRIESAGHGSILIEPRSISDYDLDRVCCGDLRPDQPDMVY